MGLIDKLRGRRGGRPQARAEPDRAAVYDVGRTRADMVVTRSEAIYAAVSRISNTIAQLPLHLYKGWEIQVDHPLERMVAYAPNDNFSAYQYQQAMEVYRNTEGSTYALIVPRADGVTPDHLEIADAASVRVLRDVDTGDIYYDLPSRQLGQVLRVHESRVISLHHMSSNGQRGVRPLDVLRDTLGYDAEIREYSKQQLSGVNSGVVLTIPGVGLSESKKDAVIEQFLASYKRSQGRVIVLEGGISASTLTQSPVDARVLDVERITRNRVATVYNIPPHMLGDYSDTSYSTAEQTMREYLDLTIVPIVTQWEQEYNRKLLTWEMVREGYAFRFDLRALARADMATTSEMYQRAIRGGWMSINEVREGEGLPPRPEGNTLLASKDLMPVGDIMRGGTA